jgi:flagella basal body P-ring formation protein FlgA
MEIRPGGEAAMKRAFPPQFRPSDRPGASYSRTPVIPGSPAMRRHRPTLSCLPRLAIAAAASAAVVGASAEPAAVPAPAASAATAARLQSMQAAQLAALARAAPAAAGDPAAGPAAAAAASAPASIPPVPAPASGARAVPTAAAPPAAAMAPVAAPASVPAPVSASFGAPARIPPAVPAPISIAPGETSAAASDGTPEALLAAGRHFLDGAVAQAPAALGGGASPLRMEVSVGALDSRLRLAPCARVEPYLPPGMRLWGRTRLGLRCVDGPVRWNVFLPVTVKAFGPAWVVPGPVAPGATLAAGDAVQAEVDWAEDASPVIADPAQWVGTTVIRTLGAGQPLRQSSVRPPQAFQAGAPVRVVAAGAGFAVASDGQAITAGFVGQPVRVRMEGGRIMSGTVRDPRTVEVVF